MATDLVTFDEFQNLGQSVQKMNLRLIETIATPPTVGNLFPPSGSIAGNDTIGFDVTSSEGVASVTVYIVYPTLGESDVVYLESQYLTGYSGSVTAIPSGYQFRFIKTRGFNAPFNLYVQATTATGAGN